MSSLSSESMRQGGYAPSEEWRRSTDLAGQGGMGISSGWLLGGLAVLGIGVWMAWHFGPDVARYIKMERM